jgi:hypothetical protein
MVFEVETSLIWEQTVVVEEHIAFIFRIKLLQAWNHPNHSYDKQETRRNRLILRSGIWRPYAPSKRRNLSKLHDVVTQKKFTFRNKSVFKNYDTKDHFLHSVWKFRLINLTKFGPFLGEGGRNFRFTGAALALHGPCISICASIIIWDYGNRKRRLWMCVSICRCQQKHAGNGSERTQGGNVTTCFIRKHFALSIKAVSKVSILSRHKICVLQKKVPRQVSTEMSLWGEELDRENSSQAYIGKHLGPITTK